jgi:peptidoglycan/LPS O-acetylase OafA/YrhL
VAIKNEYLGRVQVLRFIAATAVLVAHLQHEVVSHFPAGATFQPFTLIDGGVGVDLFFVISGFIMFHVSDKKFGRSGATGSFLIRRFLRISPLYYLATLLMIAATLAFSHSVSIPQPSLNSMIASFLFFPNVNALGEVAPILKLGWTLNFEMYFYFVFALSLNFNKCLGILFILFALLVIVLLSNIMTSPPVPIQFWGQSLVFEFMAGIGISMLFGNGQRFSAVQAITMIAAGLFVLVSIRVADMTSSLPRAIYAGLPASLIVWAVVCGPFDQRQGALKRWLVVGGEASFALYVIHPFALRAGAIIWGQLPLPASPWLYITLSTIFVIFAAVAVNTLVERPLDRWIGRRLAGSRQSLPTPSGVDTQSSVAVTHQEKG